MGKCFKNTISLGRGKKIYGVRTHLDYNQDGQEIYPHVSNSEITEQAINVVAAYLSKNHIRSVITPCGMLQLTKSD